MNLCPLCLKNNKSVSFKIEQIFNKNINSYKDFSININDDDCLNKLHILYSQMNSTC